jgi:predicted Ser/Thr protein kinase
VVIFLLKFESNLQDEGKFLKLAGRAGGTSPLTWRDRIRIVLESAQGAEITTILD